MTVQSGGTLTIGAGASVTIGVNATLTDDGTLSFATGDTVALNYGTTEIVVGNGGLLTASGTTFNGYSGYTTEIVVNSGGQLTASNSTFAASLVEVYLNNGSILDAGNFTGDSFNTPLFLPEGDVQYLSNNTQFQQIDILAGSVVSGQTLALNAIGTASTANLSYVFAGNFTVNSGATVTVAANVSVLVQTNATLTDDGTLSFTTGDTVALNYGTTEIVVGNGGLLTASGTTFNGYSGYTTEIIVNSGGQLTASNSTFAASLVEVYLNNGSILDAGNFTGDSFNCPLFLPEGDVQYLSGTGSNNAQFQQIDILAGSVVSGQTLALNAIGTASTANLSYVFAGNFTVSSGATVTVAANVSVLVQTNATLTDDGTLSFTTGDTVALNYGTTEIVVGNGGLLTASGTTFNGYSGYTTAIVVNSGGQLTASNSTFASSLYEVYLNSGSTDTIQFSSFATQFAINSGASINISSNDFSGVGTNGIIATGDPNATIELPNNYWGTTVPTQIAAKILDHLKDVTRPTVVYPPFDTAKPVQTIAAPTNTTFSSSAQNVTLTATVTSPSGTVNQGTETFTILSGTTVIGSSVTVNVSAGAASAVYALPAGTPGGIYIIEDVYSGTANFLGYTDTSQALTVNAAASTTAAASASRPSAPQART